VKGEASPRVARPLEQALDRRSTVTGADAFEQLSVADRLLVGVHRCWLERETAQMALWSAPLTSEPVADVRRRLGVCSAT
jgi:hypothetical protein